MPSAPRRARAGGTMLPARAAAGSVPRGWPHPRQQDPALTTAATPVPSVWLLMGKPSPEMWVSLRPLLPASHSILASFVPVLSPGASRCFRMMLEGVRPFVLHDGGDRPRGAESVPSASPSQYSQLPAPRGRTGTAEGHPGTGPRPGVTSGTPSSAPPATHRAATVTPQGANKLPEGGRGQCRVRGNK